MGIEWSLTFSLKVLAKLSRCSNCLEKLDECSLAHARKISASARMMGFWLKFSAEWRKHNLHHENRNLHRKQCFLHGKLGNMHAP